MGQPVSFGRSLSLLGLEPGESRPVSLWAGGSGWLRPNVWVCWAHARNEHERAQPGQRRAAWCQVHICARGERAGSATINALPPAGPLGEQQAAKEREREGGEPLKCNLHR